MARFAEYLRDRWRGPEELGLVGTALLVGISAGLGAIVFRILIRGIDSMAFDWVPQHLPALGNAYIVLVPTLGGLVVGLLVFFGARETKGHGVPEVIEAVGLHGGRIRPRVAVIKALASSICIGTGGSVGREGPIAQIGSALGSTLGQALDLSQERVRNLVACGAAGGIAATFNAPIAGVIFALEVILGEFGVQNFSMVVISSVTASAIGRWAFGDVAAFPIPTHYGLVSVWEYVLYAVLGLLAALLGALFVRLLYWSEDRFEEMKRFPEWLRPALGGALLGAVALLSPLLTGVTWDRAPEIFGVGYDAITGTLSGELAFRVVLALLFLKLLATCLTLGSGGSGGVFAPSLFLGAMLGTSFEVIARMVFPDIVAPPGAYALVGMAAVFAATAHAPITAVIILFELTGDYRIILPLMLSVVIAAMSARKLLGGESIYTMKLSRRGVRLREGRDVDVLQGIHVEDVLAQDIDTIPSDMTLAELTQFLTRTRYHGLPVLDANEKLWGVATISDLDRAIESGMPPTARVTEFGTGRDELEVAYPDESMGDALSRMSARGIGRLPVVSRADPNRFIGLVRRADIIRAYNLARIRRSEMQQHEEELRRGGVHGAEFLRITLVDGDAAVGKTLMEIGRSLPLGCVLVSIQREGRILIPHGDTRFEAGDLVTAYTLSGDAEALNACLRTVSREDSD